MPEFYLLLISGVLVILGMAIAVAVRPQGADSREFTPLKNHFARTIRQ